MIDVTVMVYLFGYLLVVYVCVWILEGSRRAGINRVHCSCQHFVVTYLIRVVACGDLCKRFTCMVVHTYMYM